MYCPSCGSAIAPGLRFCNRCGNDLALRDESPESGSDLRPVALIWAIVAVTLFGFLAMIATMVVTKEVLKFSEGLTGKFGQMVFFTIILIDTLFAWLLIRSSRQPKKKPDLVQLKETIRAEIEAARTSELAMSINSITDHTTRTLEPVSANQRVSGSAKTL